MHLADNRELHVRSYSIDNGQWLRVA